MYDPPFDEFVIIGRDPLWDKGGDYALFHVIFEFESFSLFFGRDDGLSVVLGGCARVNVDISLSAWVVDEFYFGSDSDVYFIEVEFWIEVVWFLLLFGLWIVV